MRSLSSLVLAFVFQALPAQAKEAVLFDGNEVASIIYQDHRTTELAGQLLARDLQALTGRNAVVSKDLAACAKLCVVIGRYDSPLVEGIARDAGVSMAALQEQWERYERVLIPSRSKRGQNYLLIAGSDVRGVVWGVIDLTREMGVSPWEWWADVTPRRMKRLAIAGERRRSETPSVQYRGIFLNDEDWGLQPWAAKTYEPEVGDIGPKTYARIFELMWRLKANTIWPAMHDSTKPFYQVPGNAESARDYSIVVGTSHAEPMMRNNVREWDDERHGEFNYFTNREALIDYWRERAEEVKGFENLYTIGLRGKHDSGMQGANSPDQARGAMEDAIAIQRDLLAAAQRRSADQVPQVVTLYKEVLDIYSTGLKVPSDVTLVWPDDNYGYIHQLSNPEEQKRSGGSGIYYHLSYWGRPHDYLWLGTTHPGLVREQLERAWNTDARKIWIFNVGDIKPVEYLAEYALELAFDHNALVQNPRDHLRRWASQQFSKTSAEEIADIMTEYYDLAFERRPEFMGFGQVEPIQPNRISDFVRTGGDEAERRLDRYAAIVRRAEELAASMPADRAEAFFQLVLYPVRGAASLNERILKLDLAATHAKAGRAPFNPDNSWDIAANRLSGAPRADSNALVTQAKAAHQRIIADTAAYNAQGNGKWNGIMDMAPRRLPVFQEPIYPTWALPSLAACGIDATNLSFVSGRQATRSFTLYSAGQPMRWSYVGQRGVTPSITSGNLDAGNGFSQRITLVYHGADALDGGRIQCGNQTLEMDARLIKVAAGSPPAINRIISIPATAARSEAWEVVPRLGSQGNALRARLDLPTVEKPNVAEPLTYLFATDAQGDAELRVVGVPVHPLTSGNRLRLAIRIDGGPLQVLDFQTFGRSDEWRQNVLTNTATRTVPLKRLPAGSHRLEVYPLDPGFILDRIDVRLDGAPDYYGVCCQAASH
ncbi:glycosyl hydrolase 115 family protein [Pseudoxanthomonas sp. UTMC 1351]|uniref:glycosyl hydrolase 115 family protein n=1 Tax=Pseudoxanthomonas sp. UTMC 1351 TaxID=2695853 RepID=UPI0034CE70D5